MGQYYIGTNIDKKQRIETHTHGSGAKLMEHSYFGVTIIDHAMELLSNDWSHDRIVWCGDYGEQSFLPEVKESEHANLYQYADNHFREIMPLSSPPKVSHLRYLLNHTKKEYVDLQKCKPEEDGYAIHPLPILTSDGNGKGGGDLRSDNPLIGHWAGDSISAEPFPFFIGYVEIIPDFHE